MAQFASDSPTGATATDGRLVAAAVAGDWNRVLAGLTAGGAIQSADDEGASLLHLALAQGRYELAGVLLAQGASATAVDGFGRSPLHYLAEAGDPARAIAAADVVAALVAGGGAVNAADGRGRTALHAAAVRGLPMMVAALLAAGAAVNAAKRDGQTPLHLAVTRRHLAVIELLVKHGADPEKRAADGLSPRELAAKFAYEDGARALARR